MNTIPTKINRYNVYNKGNRLLGVGEEMSLPDFEPSSETVTGAGILGEIDDPTVGYFGNQELEIPFRLLDKETADMMDMLCVVLVRGKQPTEEMITLAEERGITLMSTPERMFTACGTLWEKGLRGGRLNE